jgi:hypothetical protein
LFPVDLKADTRIIKGNLRSLTALMNNIIYHADRRLFEKESSYEDTEQHLNAIPWKKLDYQHPLNELHRLIEEHPISVK